MSVWPVWKLGRVATKKRIHRQVVFCEIDSERVLFRPSNETVLLLFDTTHPLSKRKLKSLQQHSILHPTPPQRISSFAKPSKNVTIHRLNFHYYLLLSMWMSFVVWIFVEVLTVVPSFMNSMMVLCYSSLIIHTVHPSSFVVVVHGFVVIRHSN